MEAAQAMARTSHASGRVLTLARNGAAMSPGRTLKVAQKSTVPRGRAMRHRVHRPRKVLLTVRILPRLLMGNSFRPWLWTCSASLCNKKLPFVNNIFSRSPLRHIADAARLG